MARTAGREEVIRWARGRHRLEDGGIRVSTFRAWELWCALPARLRAPLIIDQRPAFDPPTDSPFARMCRQLDDMQPTIRQLTQKD